MGSSNRVRTRDSLSDMSDPQGAPRASFTDMASCTREDWAIILPQYLEFAAGLARRVLAHLELLRGDYGGFPVDRLEHCLQTAALAHADGRDEEYVVCALLHDIGDTLGAYNHADVAAAILKPFVSAENLFMVEKHAIFQGYYFFHHIGLEPNMRDAFRDHPGFERTAEFCAKYDGPAFDPKREAPPLSFFEPMVRRLFASPKRTIYQTALDR
jgi:predicted HD phosphohydrolase